MFSADGLWEYFLHDSGVQIIKAKVSEPIDATGQRPTRASACNGLYQVEEWILTNIHQSPLDLELAPWLEAEAHPEKLMIRCRPQEYRRAFENMASKQAAPIPTEKEEKPKPRGEVLGHKITALIKWMASEGWDKPTVYAVLALAGIKDIALGTMNSSFYTARPGANDGKKKPVKVLPISSMASTKLIEFKAQVVAAHKVTTKSTGTKPAKANKAPAPTKKAKPAPKPKKKKDKKRR